MNKTTNDYKKPKYLNLAYSLVFGGIIGLSIIVLILNFMPYCKMKCNTKDMFI